MRGLAVRPLCARGGGTQRGAASHAAKDTEVDVPASRLSVRHGLLSQRARSEAGTDAPGVVRGGEGCASGTGGSRGAFGSPVCGVADSGGGEGGGGSGAYGQAHGGADGGACGGAHSGADGGACGGAHSGANGGACGGACGAQTCVAPGSAIPPALELLGRLRSLRQVAATTERGASRPARFAPSSLVLLDAPKSGGPPVRGSRGGRERG